MSDKQNKWQEKYSHEDLFAQGPQKIYKNQYLDQISFPLGGIGTGSIGLSGRGSLIDFEIFNKPNVGSKFPKTFAAIRAVEDNGKNENPVCRILEGPVQRPYTPHDGGTFHANGEGFPHMDSCDFRGEYPFAWIDFQSSKLPLEIQLEAYNPFIPSDPDASGIPCAILKYNVKNTSQQPLSVSILWSLYNLVGHSDENYNKLVKNAMYTPNGQYFNEFWETEELRGIKFGNDEWSQDHPKFGSAALSTPDEDISYALMWKPDQWFMSHYHVWNTFKEKGTTGEDQANLTHNRKSANAGLLTITKSILPGETQTFTFYITWYFPNFEKYWQLAPITEKNPMKPHWTNYYAKFYEDAKDVVIKLHSEEPKYNKYSKLFHDALFNSTVPPYIIDALQSTMSILKTTTCIRLDDGTFYGWEGCHPSEGCCEGSCTHVWGYQQALPFLFPSLERTLHDSNYKYNFFFPDLGALEFRTQLPLGSEKGFAKPCADGQFGGIIHVYREWKISGNDEWLRTIWPKVKLAARNAPR
jgi:uncharacterized protein (DUF608 family)